MVAMDTRMRPVAAVHQRLEVAVDCCYYYGCCAGAGRQNGRTVTKVVDRLFKQKKVVEVNLCL